MQHTGQSYFLVALLTCGSRLNSKTKKNTITCLHSSPTKLKIALNTQNKTTSDCSAFITSPQKTWLMNESPFAIWINLKVHFHFVSYLPFVTLALSTCIVLTSHTLKSQAPAYSARNFLTLFQHLCLFHCDLPIFYALTTKRVWLDVWNHLIDTLLENQFLQVVMQKKCASKR